MMEYKTVESASDFIGATPSWIRNLISRGHYIPECGKGVRGRRMYFTHRDCLILSILKSISGLYTTTRVDIAEEAVRFSEGYPADLLPEMFVYQISEYSSVMIQIRAHVLKTASFFKTKSI